MLAPVAVADRKTAMAATGESQVMAALAEVVLMVPQALIRPASVARRYLAVGTVVQVPKEQLQLPQALSQAVVVAVQ